MKGAVGAGFKSLAKQPADIGKAAGGMINIFKKKSADGN
jgi:hypothetical protein